MHNIHWEAKTDQLSVPPESDKSGDRCRTRVRSAST